MNIKLGQRCRIALLPIDSGTQYFEGTIVATHPSTGYCLVAWKDKEPHHFYAFKRDELQYKIDHTSVVMQSYDNYDRYLWVMPANFLIEEVQPSTLRSPSANGLFCSKCSDYFPYAESNQSDGKLICYSCRQYPFYGNKK